MRRLQTFEQAHVYKGDGSGRLPPKTVNGLWRKYYEGKGGFYPYQEKRQNKDNRDKSLRVIADDYAKKKGLAGHDRAFFEYALRTDIEQDYGK